MERNIANIIVINNIQKNVNEIKGKCYNDSFKHCKYMKIIGLCKKCNLFMCKLCMKNDKSLCVNCCPKNEENTIDKYCACNQPLDDTYMMCYECGYLLKLCGKILNDSTFKRKIKKSDIWKCFECR